MYCLVFLFEKYKIILKIDAKLHFLFQFLLLLHNFFKKFVKNRKIT